MRNLIVILAVLVLAAASGCGGEVPDAGTDAGFRSDGESIDSASAADGSPAADGALGLDTGVDARVDTDAAAVDGGPPAFTSECLGRSGPVVEVSGARSEAFRVTEVEDGTVFDASSATWTGLDRAGEPIPWTTTFRDSGTGADSCWFGASIQGPWDDTASGITWEEPYHHSGGMTIDLAGFFVEGVRIHNQGDGIRPYGNNIRIRAAYLSDIHDDCIENDDVYNLTIEDSLLDGCYVAFSARPFTDDAPDGSRNLWEVRDSLVRLEPQPTVFRGPTPGHGPFFKWDSEGRSPRVSLHNTIFRADQQANHNHVGIPDEVVFESCSGNTMVWLGDGDFPEDLPSCFTITTDRSVWDRAVAAWQARHPGIR